MKAIILEEIFCDLQEWKDYGIAYYKNMFHLKYGTAKSYISLAKAYQRYYKRGNIENSIQKMNYETDLVILKAKYQMITATVAAIMFIIWYII